MFSVFICLIYMIIAYLIGSICSAIIVCRFFHLPDPTKEGSKNPGATNVLRLAGKKYALMVFLGDMLKGLVPLLFAHLFKAGPIMLGFTCLGAVLGHVYPLFFNFKGGKGVATAIGALFGFHFSLGLLVVITWLLVAYLTRYSSLASIISLTLAPFFAIIVGEEAFSTIPLWLMTFLILYQHLENFNRLLYGKESKIDLKQKSS